MKPLIATATVLACLASVGLAQEDHGDLTRLTLTTTATFQDADKDKESKPESEHDAAIDADQDSTYTEKWGTSTFKITNRWILEEMVELELIDSIKGWSLYLVDSEGFSGVVAHKKNESPVAVPAELLTLDGDTVAEVESGNYSSKYTARNNTEKQSESGRYLGVLTDLSIDGIPAIGLDKGSYKWADTYVDGELTSERYTDSGKIDLIGGDEDVVLEGKISYSTQHIEDISVYVPEAPLVE